MKLERLAWSTWSRVRGQSPTVQPTTAGAVAPSARVHRTRQRPGADSDRPANSRGHDPQLALELAQLTSPPYYWRPSSRPARWAWLSGDRWSNQPLDAFLCC